MESFQICSKKLFLTYPECTMDKQDAFDWLLNKFTPSKLLVAHELHANGNSHLHVYMECETAIRTRNSRFADLPGPFHGNYQPAKSAKKVIQYCSKAEDFCSNFDISDLVSKKSNNRTLIGKRLIDGESLEKIVEENPALIFGYKKLKEDLGLFQATRAQNRDIREDLPGELSTVWDINGHGRVPVELDNKQCHYWFWSSQPNKGKSLFLQGLASKYNSVLETGRAPQYWGIVPSTQLILLDEVTRGTWKAQTLNGICDGTASYRKFQGGCIHLESKPLVICCSNHDINWCYPYENALIHARFIEYDLMNYNFI